jgi:hypothetical protein
MTGQTDSSKSTLHAEQEIRRINEQWVQALIDRDTATLDQLMAEGCLFTYALDGDDKAQFIADIESGDLQVNVLDRDQVEVRIYGSTGILTGFDMSEWKYKGRDIKGNYRTLHVYAEREGRWQIVAIQASPLL